MKSKVKIPMVLTTNNKHKVREISAILKKAGLGIKILILDDFPKRKAVVENKPTIEGNAIKKAKEVAKQTKCLALADDTGLFIKALKGAPGVYSARFAGRGCTFMDNNKKVLRLMKNIPFSKRQAVFRSIAALATPQGKVAIAEGRIHGKIVIHCAGTDGFGYDPIFWVPKYKKTFAEMGLVLKNRISHRALAFKKVPTLLKKIKSTDR
jgi:XTP/dITP diphosphohydrolase